MAPRTVADLRLPGFARARATPGFPGLPVMACALVITSYFYCLPLGRYAVGGFSSDYRAYDFAFAAFFLVVGIRCLPQTRPLLRDRARFHLWSLLLLLYSCLSLLLTVLLGEEVRQLPVFIRYYRYVNYLLFPLLLVAVTDTPRRQRFLVAVFYGNIVAQALLAFGQALHALPDLWPDYWTRGYFAAGPLPVGTLSPHHKQIGVVMLMGIGMTMTYLRAARRPSVRLLLLVMLFVMVSVPVFAGARTAWLGVLGFGLGYLWVYRRRGVTPLLLATLGLGLLFLAAPDAVTDPFEEQVGARFTRRIEKLGFAGISRERTAIYFEDIPRAIAQRPLILLTGIGFLNASAALHATAAHNNYLNVLIELGLIGLLLYLRYLASIMRSLRRAAALTRSRFEALLANDMRAVFIAILLTMLVGETLWPVSSMLTLTGQIMTLMALATCPLNWSRASPAEETAVERALRLRA